MKIEIRSPIKVNRTPEVLSLVETVKQNTTTSLQPKIRLAKRVKRKMAKQLRSVARQLMEEDG